MDSLECLHRPTKWSIDKRVIIIKLLTSLVVSSYTILLSFGTLPVLDPEDTLSAPVLVIVVSLTNGSP